MQSYLEQTVTGRTGGPGRSLYALAWLAIVLLAFAALFAAGNLLSGLEGGTGLSLVSGLVLLLSLAGAFAVFRFKDRLRMEYDYAIRDGRLEVTAVLNNRRRVPKLRLELGRVLSCGMGNPPAAPGERVEKLCLNPDAKITFIRYEEKGERRMALLELNDEMIAHLRTSRELQLGAWRE